MHIAAITLPAQSIVNLLIRFCNYFQYSIYAATCEEEYEGIGGTGYYWAQLFASMTAATGDYQAWCYYNWYECDAPPVIEINETEWFSPKPSGLVAPPPSGQTFNVLHLTDWHLDPRYDIGSEANCSQYLCCRPYATNTKLDTTYVNASVPASRWGYLYCDTPPDLGISLFNELPNFVNLSTVEYAIFTGDIVSHDNDDQLSQAYISYEETVTYQTFKAHLGNIVSSSSSSANSSLFMLLSETTIPGLKPTTLQIASEQMVVKILSRGIIICYLDCGIIPAGSMQPQQVMHLFITEHMRIPHLKA